MTTTLTGNKLFEYMGHLYKEIEEHMVESRGDFEYNMHSCMQQILRAETDFLKRYHSVNGKEPDLLFSSNGLPTIESLRPDLEAIVNVGGETEDFTEIAQLYAPAHKETVGKHAIDYKEMSEKEVDNLLKQQNAKLTTKRYFDINQGNDGKLELVLVEGVYLDLIDEFSQKYPISLKMGKMEYQVAWGRLVSSSEQYFFGIPTDIALPVPNDYNYQNLFLPKRENIQRWNQAWENISNYNFKNKVRIIAMKGFQLFAKENKDKIFCAGNHINQDLAYPHNGLHLYLIDNNSKAKTFFGRDLNPFKRKRDLILTWAVKKDSQLYFAFEIPIKYEGSNIDTQVKRISNTLSTKLPFKIDVKYILENKI